MIKTTSFKITEDIIEECLQDSLEKSEPMITQIKEHNDKKTSLVTK